MNTTINTKSALSASMGNAASHSNRLHSLKGIADSGLLTDEQFLKAAGFHPCTLDRQLESASADFQKAKTEYETHCAEIGVAAYQTYNED